MKFQNEFGLTKEKEKEEKKEKAKKPKTNNRTTKLPHLSPPQKNPPKPPNHNNKNHQKNPTKNDQTGKKKQALDQHTSNYLDAWGRNCLILLIFIIQVEHAIVCVFGGVLFF